MSDFPPQPIRGDVIVRRASGNTDVYMLCRFGGDDQFSFPSYELALASASGFGARERVDVWFADEPGRLVRVASYRAPESAG